jgi:hypothetical protein
MYLCISFPSDPFSPYPGQHSGRPATHLMERTFPVPSKEESQLLSQQALGEVSALVAHISHMQLQHIRRFAELHSTMAAIVEAYNIIANAVDPQCFVQLLTPESFLPEVRTLNEEIHRCSNSGTLLTDANLQRLLLQVEDTTQLLGMTEESFSKVIPLLIKWISAPAPPPPAASTTPQRGLLQPNSNVNTGSGKRTTSASTISVGNQASAASSHAIPPLMSTVPDPCLKGFTLLHEGVRLFGATLLPRKSMKPQWRAVDAALGNLDESTDLLSQTGIERPTIHRVMAFIRAGAGLPST